MELLIDRQITGAEKIFPYLGSVRLFDGRDINSTDLGQAEALIVRSVTKVNADLLSSSLVRVVGSATSGADHVDLSFLKKRGIQFFDAQGCNSRAVAEYVACCLFDYCHVTGKGLDDLTVGVIGFGHVGQALGGMLDDLSIKFVVYDPISEAVNKEQRVASLDEIFDCNVVTLHVPLTFEGKFPTAGMVNRKYLGRLKPKQLIINSARGGVLDERALVSRIQRTKKLYAVIDCWENEPEINSELSASVWRGTPHIAGHTREARHRAAEILYGRISEWLKLSVPAFPSIRCNYPSKEIMFNGGHAIRDVLINICPLDLHTQKIKALSQMAVSDKTSHFDNIRQKNGLRSEFSAYSVASSKLDDATISVLETLGFK
jgi:erythronate-4-phosphate dehydrogenase